jgi:hypothetical protein
VWSPHLAWTLCGTEHLLSLSGIEASYASCPVITELSWLLILLRLGEFPVHMADTSPRNITLVVSRRQCFDGYTRGSGAHLEFFTGVTGGGAQTLRLYIIYV